jgi:hypothetical protein
MTPPALECSDEESAVGLPLFLRHGGPSHGPRGTLAGRSVEMRPWEQRRMPLRKKTLVERPEPFLEKVVNIMAEQRPGRF